MPGGKIDILINPDLNGFDGKLSSGLRGSTSSLSKFGAGIGLAIGAGVGIAAAGLKHVIDLGTQYQNNLNQIQAVSNATGTQMAAVSAKAIALGNDLSLPATSAADAAQAMLELAKGGLSVDQAMQAAKGTLQLAAAAQISGADAATIQANALNSFGLSASNAGHVADVLANTANQSSGDITDFAQALAQSGAVAHQFGISIDDTSTELGLLANAGIKGSDAGTLLKTALTQLAAPSKPAAAAIKDLGLKVFDSTGKFVGLQSIMLQLHDASQRMTQQQFAQASATVFGTDAVRLAGVAAQDTSSDWDKMSTAVSKSGGAATVASAQMKGLGGAVQGFQSQLETVELQVFQVIAPAAEAVVREGTTVLAQVGGKAVSALQSGVKAAELFGPQVAAAIKSRAAEVGQEADSLAKPIVEGLRDATVESVAIVATYVKDIEQAGATVVGDLKPVAQAVGDVAQAADKAGGPLRTAGVLLDGVGATAKAAAGLVKPLATVTADLIKDFAGLPGPIQTAAVALVALKVGPSILGSLKSAFSGAGSSAGDGAAKTGLFGKAVSGLTAPVKVAASTVSGAVGTLRQFSGEMQVQQALAKASGDSIGKMGAAAAAFNTSTIPAVRTASEFVSQTKEIQAGAAAAGSPINGFSAAIGTLVERSPALSAMKGSFDTASAGASRFGTLAGTAAAAGTGLKAAAGGLVGALGGPFGIAVAGASLLLGVLAAKQEAAAKAAAAQKQDVDNLAGSLDKTTGAVTEQTRQLQDQKNQSDGVTAAAGRQGIALDTLLDAQTGNSDAINQVNQNLNAQAQAFIQTLPHADSLTSSMKEAGLTMSDFAGVAVGSVGALKKVQAGIGSLGEKGEGQDLAAFLQRIQLGSGDFNVLGVSVGEANKELKIAQKHVNDTAKAMGTTSENAAGLIGDMEALSGSTSTEADKANALNDALNRLNGGQIDLNQTQSNVNQTFSNFDDTLKSAQTNAQNVKGGVDGFGASLVSAAGKINTATTAGQQFQQFAHDTSSNLSDLAAQTFQVSQQAGDTLPTSFKKTEQAAQGVRDKFIATAEQMGISKTAANKLADAYGLIPSEVATLVTDKGSAPQVQREVQNVIDKVNAVPPNKSVTINGLTGQAESVLKTLGLHVRNLPDGSVVVSARDLVTSAVNQIIRTNSGRTIHVNVATGQISAQGLAKAQGGIVEHFAQGGLKPMRGGVATVVSPNTWRVIGDRMRDDESYIPINRSQRSTQILAETATRMGFDLVRQYAIGGIAGTSSATPIQARTAPIINNNVTVRDNESAATAAQIVSSQVAWQLRISRRG